MNKKNKHLATFSESTNMFLKLQFLIGMNLKKDQINAEYTSSFASYYALVTE